MVSIKYQAIVMSVIFYLTFVFSNDNSQDMKTIEVECLRRIHQFFALTPPEEESDLYKLGTLDFAKRGIYWISTPQEVYSDIDKLEIVDYRKIGIDWIRMQEKYIGQNLGAWRFYFELGFVLDPNSIKSPEEFCKMKNTPGCLMDLKGFGNEKYGALMYALYLTEHVFQEKNENTISYLRDIINTVQTFENNTFTPKKFCTDEAKAILQHKNENKNTILKKYMRTYNS